MFQYQPFVKKAPIPSNWNLFLIKQHNFRWQAPVKPEKYPLSANSSTPIY